VRTNHRGRLKGGAAALFVGFAFLITMLGTTLPTPLYPAFGAEFGFGELLTTVVFAVYPVGVTAALLVCGRWSDQLGRKPMLLAGLGCSAASALAILAANSIWWLYAGRLLSGFSAGIFTGTATAAIVDVIGSRSGSAANLLAAVVNMGGLGLGPLVAGTLAEWAPSPMEVPFRLDLGLVALAGMGVMLIAEPLQEPTGGRLQFQRISVPAEMRPVFLRAAIAGFAGFAVMGLFGAVSPAFLGDVLHRTSPALIGAIVAAVFGASVLGQLLSSRFETSGALTIGCAALMAGMVLLGIGLPLASLTLLVVGGLIAGLGQGLSFRAGLASVTAASPAERRGEIASAYFVALYVAIAIPVVGEGAAAAAFGLVTAGVLFACLVGLLAATVLMLLVRGTSGERERSSRVSSPVRDRSGTP
jgi:MFS family permease